MQTEVVHLVARSTSRSQSSTSASSISGRLPRAAGDEDEVGGPVLGDVVGDEAEVPSSVRISPVCFATKATSQPGTLRITS